MVDSQNGRFGLHETVYQCKTSYLQPRTYLWDIFKILTDSLYMKASWRGNTFYIGPHKRPVMWRGGVFYHKKIERHTAHTIVSWPIPKQWVILHTSDLMMVIRQSKYILSIITKEMGKLKTHSPTYCVMDNWENMFNLTHSTKYIWQAFCKFNIFRQVCTMTIMRWCTVQTNEYDLQAKTYPTIYIHHKLHNNSENKFPVFPERICNKRQNTM